jgi:hypothetical protein
MARARIPEADGMAAVAQAVQVPGSLSPVAARPADPSRAADLSASRGVTATAVRFLLQALADRVPGNSVEVRVPPFGAVQCIEGPRHTRGTPPNVVEMDAATWLALATGSQSWAEAVARGAVHASGTRATLEHCLPVYRPR